MARIVVVTRIEAPPARCFDLARDIDFHVASMAHTGERAVAGVTSGLIGLGESVTWEARHLGWTWNMTNAITVMDRPTHFQDATTRGPFREFVHDHEFERVDGATVMTDRIRLRSPLGLLGALVDWLFMARYMERLLTERALAIKAAAEAR